MTIPQWALLAFATWTVFLLAATIGVYRWSRILSGRAQIAEFRADGLGGEGWYQRATRAHANCVENLPVFGAIVLALSVSGVGGSAINYLSIIIPLARVMQSSVHVCFEQTNAVVSVRFTFFSVQLVSFIALIVMIFSQAGLKP